MVYPESVSRESYRCRLFFWWQYHCAYGRIKV